MSKLQPVRGTKDWLPDEMHAYSHIVHTAKRVSALYGYETMQTPVFEFTDVFKCTLGDTSDVVNKEMYTFDDRGGESITLRPEFTAGIARSFISEGQQQNLPLKFFCAGPLFRYERPQKGRLRQFHQINFECLGIEHPHADVELIAMVHEILTRLGLQNIAVAGEALGDEPSRDAYRAALVKFLAPKRSQLSEDSQRRLDSNPLRILDSKDPADKALVQGAPQIHEYFTPEAKAFFAAVLEGLKLLNIPHKVNHAIVRGLDYYTHTVFEFISHDAEMGTQNTVFAGGRYDGLIAQMGGPSTPAVGGAGGIERLALVAKLPERSAHKAMVIPMGEAQQAPALALVQQIRAQNIAVELGYMGGNFGKMMKKADKQGVTLALILGEQEMQQGRVTLKNMLSGDQQTLATDEAIAVLEHIQKELGR